MPKQFNNCRKRGGRIRTLSGPRKNPPLRENQYMHVCFFGGKMYLGEIKNKKKRYE